MNQLQSQILGLLLGLSTAIGCIYYEKLVSNFSYIGFLLIWLFEVVLIFFLGSILFKNDIGADFKKFISDSKYWWWSLIYVSTGITSLLWYKITKHQGIMTSSLYEVKYIVMLAVIYILFGGEKFTINTLWGILLAMGSIYFISKS